VFTDVQVFLKKYIVIAHIRDNRSVMALEATETSVKVKTGCFVSEHGFSRAKPSTLFNLSS